MNNSQPRRNKLNLLVLGLAGGFALLLTACQVLNTTLPVAREKTITGVPYFLPKSLLRVSIESKKNEKGSHTELLIGTSTELVPDKDAGLVLAFNGNETFSRKQTIQLTNGMLSSITTEDDGKSGEIITDLASIAFNIMSFGSAGLGAVPMDFVPVSVSPDGKEKLEALSLIAPGQHVYILPLNEDAPQYLPGTEGLVAFRSKTANLPTESPNDFIRKSIKAVKNKKPESKKITGLAIAPLKPINPKPVFQPFTSFDGIVTKVLEPYTTQVELVINLRSLYQRRIQKMDDLTEAKTKEVAKTEKEITAIKEILKDESRDKLQDGKRQENIKALEKAITESNEEMTEAAIKRAKNVTLFDNAGIGEPPLYPIANQASSILVPDYSPIVKIPMSRSPVGKTTYTLQLNRGVLTSISFDRPSAGLEIVKIPLKISEALIKLPTQLIQLKIDYSSKVKDLVTKEAELKKAKQELADFGKEKEKTDHEIAIEVLEQEKAILALQAEIAGLKAKIAELEQQ